jgi:hypothetical protein
MAWRARGRRCRFDRPWPPADAERPLSHGRMSYDREVIAHPRADSRQAPRGGPLRYLVNVPDAVLHDDPELPTARTAAT